MQHTNICLTFVLLLKPNEKSYCFSFLQPLCRTQEDDNCWRFRTKREAGSGGVPAAGNESFTRTKATAEVSFCRRKMFSWQERCGETCKDSVVCCGSAFINPFLNVFSNRASTCVCSYFIVHSFHCL